MNSAALIFALITATLLLLAFWGGLETRMLARHEPPITWWTRKALVNYPHIMAPLFLTVAFVLGLLTSHFWWDQCASAQC